MWLASARLVASPGLHVLGVCSVPAPTLPTVSATGVEGGWPLPIKASHVDDAPFVDSDFAGEASPFSVTSSLLLCVRFVSAAQFWWSTQFSTLLTSSLASPPLSIPSSPSPSSQPLPLPCCFTAHAKSA